MTNKDLEKILADGIIDSNILSYETLPSPRGLMIDIPLTKENGEFILRARKQIKDILDKKDGRKILIAGPCSIHDVRAGMEYAHKLNELSDEVSGELLVVMRTYFEKPRTIIGWTGLVYDPYLDGSYNIGEGLRIARKFLTEVTEIKMPCATEFVGSVCSPVFC